MVSRPQKFKGQRSNNCFLSDGLYLVIPQICALMRNNALKFQAYYRRGAALSGLNRHEEACLAFLQCLALDPMIATAKTALAKVRTSADSAE